MAVSSPSNPSHFFFAARLPGAAGVVADDAADVAEEVGLEAFAVSIAHFRRIWLDDIREQTFPLPVQAQVLPLHRHSQHSQPQRSPR